MSISRPIRSRRALKCNALTFASDEPIERVMKRQTNAERLSGREDALSLLLGGQDGATLTEYSVLIVLIVFTATVAIRQFTLKVNTRLCTIGGEVERLENAHYVWSTSLNRCIPIIDVGDGGWG